MRNQTSCQRKLAVQSDGRETSEAESRCLMRRRSTQDDDDDADVTSQRPTPCDLDTTEMQATSQHSAANLRSLFCTVLHNCTTRTCGAELHVFTCFSQRYTSRTSTAENYSLRLPPAVAVAATLQRLAIPAIFSEKHPSTLHTREHCTRTSRVIPCLFINCSSAQPDTRQDRQEQGNHIDRPQPSTEYPRKSRLCDEARSNYWQHRSFLIDENMRRI